MSNKKKEEGNVLVIYDTGEGVFWFIAGEEFVALNGVYINQAKGDEKKQEKLTSLMYTENGEYSRVIYEFHKPLSISELGCKKIVLCGFLP